jgi:hypothetical protein
MSTNQVNFRINILGDANKGIANIGKEVEKTTSKFQRLTDMSQKIANIGFAFQHVGSIINKVNNTIAKYTNAYEAQAVAETKLATVMRQTMNASNAEIQSIKELASAQQRLGVIGDEVQLAGAQELSTYLQKSASIEKILPKMNDMIAQQYGLNASQEQAVQIATMVGKVLQGQKGRPAQFPRVSQSGSAHSGQI